VPCNGTRALADEPPAAPVTWLFDEGTFSPAARPCGGQAIGIACDHPPVLADAPENPWSGAPGFMPSRPWAG
jgi:hypothetical protein